MRNREGGAGAPSDTFLQELRLIFMAEICVVRKQALVYNEEYILVSWGIYESRV